MGGRHGHLTTNYIVDYVAIIALSIIWCLSSDTSQSSSKCHFHLKMSHQIRSLDVNLMSFV